MTAVPEKMTPNFRYREREMLKLLRLLCEGHKIVPVIGLQGIGKSALAIETLHYAAQRKMFPGGAILLKLTGVKSSATVCTLLLNTVVESVHRSKDHQ